jgi:hypothetical protein
MEALLIVPVILGFVIALFAVVFVVKLIRHNTKTAYREGRYGKSRSRSGGTWVAGGAAYPHTHHDGSSGSWDSSDSSSSSSGDSGGSWWGGGDSGGSSWGGGDSGSSFSGGGDSGGGSY